MTEFALEDIVSYFYKSYNFLSIISSIKKGRQNFASLFYVIKNYPPGQVVLDINSRID
jgi:hypothetical protein